MAAVAALDQAAFAARQPWTVEQVWAELAGVPQRRHYVVAESAGALVGYAGVAFAGDTADVMTVAVAPGARRSGIGRALVSDLVRAARGAGALEVLLEVRADNDPAQRLYAALEFTPIARRRDYYGSGVDGIVMRRRLPHGGRLPQGRGPAQWSAP